MLFDLKSIVLYGLVALAHASPLPELSKRAKLSDFHCPDGTTLSEHDICEALHECQTHDDGKVGKYPAHFGNKSNYQKVFNNIPDSTDLREFPIIVVSAGVPGAYRVVTDYKDNRGDFRGVMQHTGTTVGGAYTACTRVANTKPDPVKEKEENATRAKKKKVGSATCSDGVTLSKDSVGNAFKECKKFDNRGVGGYPHKFGNKSGNGQVFEGVTKDLREYPIIEGGTWTGGVPGKYRVVTDYKDNFVGVMIEDAGASFSRCTVDDD
ncbi:Guanine-specific ribonuclease N1/T1 [Penicillium vulpinum]|uniref:Guanine-specific ribonuclease N1/T1 n=1 Tax=Penicillium vulpinum TaxID=29845 RepID=UPI002548DA89|nr:Guanine-specific ribonuclease N1/T1 [Penicillium vulpinum]KAJ5971424.1 Guanine-specific ribonuclease N1/T1 [Penicillium vulpinum]